MADTTLDNGEESRTPRLKANWSAQFCGQAARPGLPGPLCFVSWGAAVVLLTGRAAEVLRVRDRSLCTGVGSIHADHDC